MKKKKILLLVLFGLFTLLFNSRVVLADNDDKFVGYINCNYKIGKGLELTQDYGFTSLSFYYSDVFIDTVDLSKYLFESENFDVVNLKSQPAYLGAFDLNKTDTSVKSFKNSYSVNDSLKVSCPKYFFITKDNVPTFSNKKCNGDESNCKLIAEEIAVSSDAHVKYTNEEILTFNPTGSCKNIDMQLFVDADGNRLKAKHNNKSVNVTTEGFSKDATSKAQELMSVVYDLFKNGKIYPFAFKKTSGKENFIFGGKAIASDSCASESVYSKTEYNCVTYASIEEEIEQVYFDMYSRYSKLETELTRYLCYEENKYGEAPSDFTEYFVCPNYDYSAEEFKEVVNNLDSLFNETEVYFKNEDNAYNKYFNKYTSEEFMNSMCKTDRHELETKRKSIERYANALHDGSDGKPIGALTNKYQSLIKRLNEDSKNVDNLDSDTKNKLNGLSSKLDNVSSNYTQVYEFVDRMSFIDFAGDVGLEFNEGCGIITPDLEAWLTQLLDIIKISALVLTLILGMIDFFRGVASGSADTMKKVWTNFSRRLLVVVILFLLPVLLEFILGMLNITGLEANNPLCGLK